MSNPSSSEFATAAVAAEPRFGPARILATLTQLGMMQLAVGATGIVRNKVLAIYLGPGGFGEFAQLAAVALALYTFVQFGMALGLGRHIAAESGMAERQKQLGTANTVTVGLAIVSIVLLIPILLS